MANLLILSVFYESIGTFLCALFFSPLSFFLLRLVGEKARDKKEG